MIARAERLWPESTVVIAAGGPSLTAADVDACRGRAKVLAVKDVIRLAPWADALYACDAKWWLHYGPTLTYDGPAFALEAKAEPWATVLKNTGYSGLELEPSGLRIGKTSGYQAINLAVHLGARTIVLLGYDLKPAADRERWCGRHPWASRSWAEVGPMVAPFFDSLVEPLTALGIRILNASRETVLTCFERVTLDEALAC